MSILPPSKNQPMDYETINQLVSKVNDLDKKVNLSSGKSAIGTKVTRTSDIIFVADQVPVNKSVTVDEIWVRTWDIGGLGVAFKTPPIVTATIISNSSNESVVGNSAIVTISKVSVSTVEYRVHFTKAGKAEFGVNLIAVGISATDKV